MLTRPRFTVSPETSWSYSTLDAQVDIHPDHLEVNGYAVKAIGLKNLPASTQPNLLQELLAIPCDLIVCSEWKAQSNLRMRRVIKSKQTSFDALLVNVVALAIHGCGVPKSELPRKHEVEAHYDSLGECMKEIENRGNYFGQFCCTVILLGRSLDRVRESFSSVVKVFGRYDASLIHERLNLWEAWLSILRGNYQHSHRYHYLMNVNYADMALIWASYTGDKWNKHLDDEHLCTFETADQQLLYFNGHVGGVMGIQITGAPEAGKSFVTNYVTGQAQKYKPVTMILDIGHSYQDLTAEFKGSYFEISLQRQDAQINPFSLQPTVDNLQFLFYFVRMLLGKNTSASLEEQAAEDIHIHEAVDAIYGLKQKDRRLRNLSLPAKLYARLTRWCEGGQYGHLFDNERDSIAFSHFTTFEFQGMETHLDALAPLLFYVTYGINPPPFYAGYPLGGSSISANIASIMIADGQSQAAMRSIANSRSNQPLNDLAIWNLEFASQDTTLGTNSEVEQLNQINSGSVLANRQAQDQSSLLTTIAEQQILANKIQRDALADNLNVMSIRDQYVANSATGWGGDAALFASYSQ